MQIGIEDFRVMTESFGMQLDDDSLLALFSRVRPLPALAPALPYLDVPCPALPCPALPWPASPRPALPCPPHPALPPLLLNTQATAGSVP